MNEEEENVGVSGPPTSPSLLNEEIRWARRLCWHESRRIEDCLLLSLFTPALSEMRICGRAWRSN